MDRETKSKINRAANALALQLAKDFASVVISQSELNRNEPIRVEVRWDQARETFASEYLHAEGAF